MHLFTESKVALREAVTKPSSRLSPWELIANLGERQREKDALRHFPWDFQAGEKVSFPQKKRIRVR
jgi:hypothetical protein